MLCVFSSPALEKLPAPPDRRVMCYPSQHSLPPHRLPVIEHCNEKDVTRVTYNGETHTLKLQYMMKLEQLYQNNCEDGVKFDYFLPRVWCLLRRYQVSGTHLAPRRCSCYYTTKLLGGYIGFTPSVRLSVRPSVPCPSRILCPLCSFYSSGWIHFIFIHLIKQLQKVCRM